MIDFLRWTLVIEVVGVAFLPLTFWTLQRLPDRGYIFARALGLVLITYVTWLAGSIVPVSQSIVIPVAVLILVGAGGWWLLRAPTLDAVRSLRSTILVEEGLFLGALLLWSLLRANALHGMGIPGFGPGIDHTEQYMDMSFLGASIRSASFPPYDPWMSGHTINYYYMGYLLFAIVIKLAGVAPTVGYNLALSFLGAFTIAGSFSLGFALTRKYYWALVAPLFVAVVGNWHGVIQAHAGHDPANTYYWFWESTRVLENTITEFPFFSFMLGDLHPHLMALPVALLAVAFGVNLVLSPDVRRMERSVAFLLPLLLAAVTIGMLFTMNSWDFPTYLLVVSVCLVVQAYMTDDSLSWWRTPAILVVVLAIVSLALYAPFFVHFQSLTKGVGFVNTPSNIGEFIQVFGLPLLPSLLLVGCLAVLLQPTSGVEDVEDVERPFSAHGSAASEAGMIRAGGTTQIVGLAALLAIVLIGARFHSLVFVLMMALCGSALVVLHRVTNTEEPNRADAAALILVAVGCLMLALPEIVYVRDSFDGSSVYRMNTVFKFYYQAWILLGVAAAYGVYRGWHVLRNYFSPSYAWAASAVVAAGVLAGLFYTLNAPQSANQGGPAQSLNGVSALEANAPGDYAAVQWLRGHVTGSPVELEATGGEYDTRFARVSTFTGLPTVLGWGGHEYQWRGSDPEIQQRSEDIKSMYTTTNVQTAQTLLRKYAVRYVIVGATERSTYAGPGLDKFGRFMHPVMSDGDTTLYAW